VVASQAPGDVRENNVAIVQLDGKRRAGKNLFDTAVDFQRSLFVVFDALLDRSGCGVAAAVARSDKFLPFF
jgi:hypothetical protein